MQKIFILGNPRSGTSLFRIMLNAHKEIISPPESGFLQWWYEKYKNWDSSSIDINVVEGFLEDLKSSKKIEAWNLKFDELKETILNSNPKNYGELMELVYLGYAKLKNKQVSVIADKNNYYINHLNVLEKVWPNANYILVIRDGRDVACSYRNLERLNSDSPYRPNLPIAIDEIANEWVYNNEKTHSYLKSFKLTSSITVRYEDLVSDTVTTLKRVCQFAGVSFSDSMLKYFEKDMNDEPASTLDWKMKTFEKPDKKNIGKYKVELNRSEIELFNKIGQNTLRKFNYSI